MTRKELARLRKLAPGPERERLLAYLDALEDPQTRRIFELRFLRGLSWERIAVEIGGSNTGENMRKRVYRRLKKDRDK